MCLPASKGPVLFRFCLRRQEPTCDTDGVLSTPEQPEGVTATGLTDRGTGPGTYTFTFTADEGYVLAEGVEATFTSTVEAATGDCETTPPPTTPPTTEPTPTETTTTTTLPPVTTTVTPPNTPQKRLPNTGAGDFPALEIGLGLAGAAGISALMFMRRKTGRHESDCARLVKMAGYREETPPIY